MFFGVVDCQLRQLRLERAGALACDVLSRQLAGPPGGRGHVEEERPGRGDASGVLVAVREVELGADAGVEPLALLELGAGVGVAAGCDETPRLVEEHGRRRRIRRGRGPAYGADIAAIATSRARRPRRFMIGASSIDGVRRVYLRPSKRSGSPGRARGRACGSAVVGGVGGGPRDALRRRRGRGFRASGRRRLRRDRLRGRGGGREIDGLERRLGLAGDRRSGDDDQRLHGRGGARRRRTRGVPAEDRHRSSWSRRTGRPRPGRWSGPSSGSGAPVAPQALAVALTVTVPAR